MKIVKQNKESLKKAKAYDEAIERASKLRVQNPFDTVSQMMEYVFPELKKSEDENMRKRIIQALHGDVLDMDEISKCTAWLEKQGEPMEINPTEFDTRLQVLIGKFESLPKEELVGSLSFWLNVVKNDGTYKPDKKRGEQKPVNDDAEKEKSDYVSGQFLYCKGSFNEFKEGESYWLEYIGNDDYIGRSDNILNQKFHITPRQLYTWLDPRHDCGSNENNEPKFKIEKDKWYICIRNLDDNYGTRAFYKGDIYRSTKDETLIPVNSNVPYEIKYCAEDYFKLWDIFKDAKEGDVLINWNNTIFIFKAIEDETVKFHIAYNEKWNAIKTPSTKLSHLGLPEPQFEFHPATKEQKNILFKAIAEAGYEWDAEKKELNKIVDEEQIKKNLQDNSFRKRMFEQKPVERSEKDETTLERIISNYKYFCDALFLKENLTDVEKEAIKKVDYEDINWLESLRPKNHWKPSDKQLEALNNAIVYWPYAEICSGYTDNYTKMSLKELYKQLSNLKENNYVYKTETLVQG